MISPKDKIVLADLILDFIQNRQTAAGGKPMIHVGNLSESQGVQGFKPTTVGHPVFDTGDRYSIIQESLDGTRSVQTDYYKTKSFEDKVVFFDEYKLKAS